MTSVPKVIVLSTRLTSNGHKVLTILGKNSTIKNLRITVWNVRSLFSLNLAIKIITETNKLKINITRMSEVE